MVHNHLWITTTIIPGKWDWFGGGGGGGGVIEERYYYYYYYYYYCIVVATDVRPDYVRHLKRAFYTKHMASSEEEARPKKGNGAWWMWSFRRALWGGWIAHTLTRRRTSTQTKQNQSKVQLWHERSELVSCSYENAFLRSLSALQPQKGFKKNKRTYEE